MKLFKIYIVSQSGTEQGAYTFDGRNKSDALTRHLQHKNRVNPWLYPAPIQQPRSVGYKQGYPKGSLFYRVDSRKYLVIPY